MRAVLVLAGETEPSVAQTLDRLDVVWKAAASIEESEAVRPDDGWQCCIAQPRDARDLTPVDVSVPTLAVVKREWLSDVGERLRNFDDFVVLPSSRDELEVRISRLVGHDDTERLVFGALTMEPARYQCSVDGRTLDFTYMEFELLRHLMCNPGRVFSREHLLREVWGYEYYGGARTVDVHVRRLRAKIGEERAQVIQTVRSVGYMLGDV